MKKTFEKSWKLILVLFISGILLIVIILKFFPEDKECVKKEREEKVVKVIEQPSVKKEEEISSQEKISEKVPCKKVIPKEIIPEKAIPKKTVSQKVTSEEPTPKKLVPKKITFKKAKSFSLSLEEEKFLVEELKKHLCPESEEEGEKLFDIVKLLKESDSLSKYNDLLCVIVEENLNHEIFGSLISEKAICYLAKIGSSESIPTLLWAFANTDNPFEREISKKVIKIIKEGKKIDLEPLFSDRFVYFRNYNKVKRPLGGIKPVPIFISKDGLGGPGYPPGYRSRYRVYRIR